VKHVLWPFVLLVCLEISIIIVSTVVAPPSWQRVYLDPFIDAFDDDKFNDDDDDNDDGQQLETCNIAEDHVTVVTTALNHTLMIVTQGIVIWMAFKTRNISEAIVDTKRVYQLMICQMVLFIPYMLLSYGVIPMGKWYYMLDLFLPFLYSVTSVGFLICPKLYYVWYEKHNNGELPDGAITLGVGTTKVYGLTNKNNSTTNATTSTTRSTTNRSTVPTSSTSKRHCYNNGNGNGNDDKNNER